MCISLSYGTLASLTNRTQNTRHWPADLQLLQCTTPGKALKAIKSGSLQLHTHLKQRKWNGNLHSETSWLSRTWKYENILSHSSFRNSFSPYTVVASQARCTHGLKQIAIYTWDTQPSIRQYLTSDWSCEYKYWKHPCCTFGLNLCLKIPSILCLN